MYGQIHCVIRELVQKKFGNETWETVLKASGLDEHQSFLMFNRYDDASTFQLVGAVSETLAISVEAVLEVFGEFFFDYCIRHGYDKMLQTLGHDIKSFIQNLDSLHSLLALSYKGISAPSFRCEDGPEGSLILHYYSSRPGLYPIVKGVLKAVARDLFDQSVEMSILEQNKEDIGCDKFQEHTAFLVQLRCNSTKSIRSGTTPCDDKSLVSFNPEMVLLKASDFCSAFPYHVIFDRNLKIKQCGVLIQKHSNHVIKEGTPLNLAFDIMHPKMVISIDNIRKFINAVFLLAICSQDKEKKRMVVKGQMIWIEDTQHMIFIGSPRLTSLNELMEMNVYLADIPLYDVTRELVLLNQQRIAEIDIAKKLDETTAQLKKTGQQLEEEKRKTETLLHQMLPRKVAMALTQGRTVEAEKFDQVTILFSDIVTFTNIASACSPMDIVDLLNEMYRRFDEKTCQHNVYKVETIGDAYMIVSGVPEKTDFHGPPVANFAMDMLEEAAHVNSPATGKPLQIRVGVHTGPVVAGVVGVKMPRYCLFGDTVNTASRMESHGCPGRIHLSASTRKALQGWGYSFKIRDEMEIKGKGKMATYFLTGTQDRQVDEPDDEFGGLENTLDTDENRVEIPTNAESCDDLDQKGLEEPTTSPTPSSPSNEEKERLQNRQYYEDYSSPPLNMADDEIDDCSEFAVEKRNESQPISSSKIVNDVDKIVTVTSEALNNGYNNNTNSVSSSSPSSSTVEIGNGCKLSLEDVSPHRPKHHGANANNTNTTTGNGAGVENVFFNVCCGFSSSMFSNKEYNPVNTSDNNENPLTMARTSEQQDDGCIHHFSTHQQGQIPKINTKTLSTTILPKATPSSIPNDSKPLYRKRQQLPENSNSNMKNKTVSEKANEKPGHKPNRTHQSNVISPLHHTPVIVSENTFSNDSSLTSVQSSYTAIIASPEAHPNHVHRCNKSSHSKTFASRDNKITTKTSKINTNSNVNPNAIESAAVSPNEKTSTTSPSNNIQSGGIGSSGGGGGDGGGGSGNCSGSGIASKSCPVPISDISSRECNNSSTNLQTSWSHDQLLKVRKTRKKHVKKDRSKMCNVS